METEQSVQERNELTSAKEVADFKARTEDRWFVYINEKTMKATTWMGDVLGSIGLGPVYRDNFGGRRRAVYMHGVDGRKWSGTYYTSAGEYARVRVAKRPRW